ncbi:3'-5' exonuclease [Candidatus Moduliflexus flocculans]|uniref:3'-5' exonuclease n=1 Tax=Candidatus Moduliflexus flocculans TaxID=1499966 RepID=A0A0S6W4Z4_9BACT|nr:3'-5' exonuclease [Candidatus Moduliflexus flocculans]
MDYVELRSKHAVLAYLHSLERNIISVDIEGEYNLHEYGEKVCLVQIYDGEQFVLIDPLAVEQDALKKLFENSHLLKVMYGAASDLSVLKNGHDIECKSVFDLQPAVKLLGQVNLNLHAALRLYLGVELTQKKKFQRYNWTKRPIETEAIQYALDDVRYLLELKDVLLRQLAEQGTLEQFFLENMMMQHKDYTRIPGQRLRKSREFDALTPDGKTRFEGIFAIRERYAQQANTPPHQLLANQDLFMIVKNPSSVEQIVFSPKIQRDLIASLAQEIRAFLQNN